MLLDPGGGFTSETAERRFQKRNGSFTAVSEVNGQKCKGYIFNGHLQTEKSARSGATAMQRPWPLVKGNGFILVSECLPGLPGIISAPSKAVGVTKGSKPNLSH